MEEKDFSDYINNIRKVRPLIDKALKETKSFCDNYLRAKEDLAYLAYFRNKISFDFKTACRIHKHNNPGTVHPKTESR